MTHWNRTEEADEIFYPKLLLVKLVDGCVDPLTIYVNTVPNSVSITMALAGKGALGRKWDNLVR